jgi:hypothetical protein
MSNGVYSLPAINFTDTTIPNQMIKTLSEALAAAPQVNPRGKGKENSKKINFKILSLGFYYPYPYQNLNWYNFPYLWPAVAGGLLDPTAPFAGIGAQLIGLGTGGCPTGLCPTGATCSQLSGQWQCGCGLNGCVGSKFYLNFVKSDNSFSLNLFSERYS